MTTVIPKDLAHGIINRLIDRPNVEVIGCESELSECELTPDLTTNTRRYAPGDTIAVTITLRYTDWVKPADAIDEPTDLRRVYHQLKKVAHPARKAAEAIDKLLTGGVLVESVEITKDRDKAS
ncbi:MAG TPA: hypothetical protein VGN72_07745 [Tepidisphaeraceae bacterium]|jgi:hypothetical protein|nr:hypothetical protein [Tepidisphaeraceae bacterium]